MVKMTMSDLSSTLSVEEKGELDAAEQRQPVFDADSPEMTAEMLAQFKRMKYFERSDLDDNV